MSKSKENRLSVHFMGIGGSGMSAVAQLAHYQGYQVSGCDLQTKTPYLDKLTSLGLKIDSGHSQAHLKNTDILCINAAAYFQPQLHPEIKAAEKKIIVMRWQEFLGRYLHQDKRVICIAGTHGKSTTTAMTSLIFEHAGLEPSVMIGATVKEWGTNFRIGKGDTFITESDEFFDNFLFYHPNYLLLNNIEFDHPDYFKSEAQLFDSFKNHLLNIPSGGTLIVNQDSSGIAKLLKLLPSSFFKKVKLIGFSITKPQFTVPLSYRLTDFSISLQIPGIFNLSNALGAAVIAKLFAVDDDIISSALHSYTGIGRRLELLGTTKKISVYDDYGHHPTAIKVTLNALRQKYPRQKIWVVCEPHSYSRTKALLNEYEGAFADADEVIIAPIFIARDTDHFGVAETDLVRVSAHPHIQTLPTFVEIIELITKRAKAGDIIIVFGAGNSYYLSRDLLKSLSTPSLTQNQPLAPLTTFHLGGPAQYFLETDSILKIKEACTFANTNSLPVFILGEGSDILVSDEGLRGLVIKPTMKQITIDRQTKDTTILTIGAGQKWDDFVEYAVKSDLQGVECLSGIPGTVGAAPVQNVGAYGQELADVLVKTKVLDLNTLKIIHITKRDCQFGYRTSLFKQTKSYLILSVTFRLNKSTTPTLTYRSLTDYLHFQNLSSPTLGDVRKAVLHLRSQKLPNIDKIGNAGSFFQNPFISSDQLVNLQKHFPNIPFFQNGNTVKLYAGWLIEQAGWKGKKYGHVAVYSKNALVLTNPESKGTSQQVKALADKIIKSVHRKFGITLIPEVQYL